MYFWGRRRRHSKAAAQLQEREKEGPRHSPGELEATASSVPSLAQLEGLTHPTPSEKKNRRKYRPAGQWACSGQNYTDPRRGASALGPTLFYVLLVMDYS